MHLFAGFISKEEGFPQENGGGPGAPASGRQPWVAPAEEEFFREPLPQRGHPGPVQPAFSTLILQVKLVLQPRLDTPQS